MIELMRTNDPVLISAVTAALQSEGIRVFVFDNHTSILEGSIGAIPRRIMIAESDKFLATRIVEALEAEIQ